MYTPLTTGGRNARTMGYWFATGHWFAQKRTDWTPDFSSDFGDYCARRRDQYEAEHATSLPSIPDLWNEYLTEMTVDTDPTPPHGTERPA